MLGFSIATGFVALLTFIFSFLGTIFCAALTGMMLGATRCRIWKSALCSLMFPGVLFTMMYASKSELPPGRLTILAGLCLVAFWLTYPGARALISFEDKTRQTVVAGRAGAVPMPDSRANFDGNGGAETLVETGGLLSLEQLQGSWSCQSNGSAAEATMKRMEIAKDKLTLELRAADGHLTFTATAQVRVDPHDATILVHAGRNGRLDKADREVLVGDSWSGGEI